MDVEQLRKINEMSKTLQKHGLATTSEEGSRLAGTVIEEGLPEENKVPQQPVSTPTQNTDKAELLIERHTRKVQQVLEALSEKITQLEARIDMQEQQLRAPKMTERVVINDVPPQQSMPPQEQHMHIQEQSQPQAPAMQQAQPAAQQKTRPEGSKPQLRSDPDNFDVSELSVEKMFYYGNK